SLSSSKKLDPANRQRQDSAIRHCVTGVHAKVQHRKFEFALVDMNAARTTVHLCPDFDVAAKRALEHLLELGEHFSKIENCRFECLAACEGQELTGQVLSAFDRGGDHLQRSGHPFVMDGPPQFVGRTSDHHQQIVEIMSNSTRQLSHRLQSL